MPKHVDTFATRAPSIFKSLLVSKFEHIFWAHILFGKCSKYPSRSWWSYVHSVSNKTYIYLCENVGQAWAKRIYDYLLLQILQNIL